MLIVAEVAQGIAPEAKIIPLKVLNEDGVGTTAKLIQALDWIYTNRMSKNIKIVNLSFGAAAIESYRTDPLCRASLRLVDAGIVVVAAAGNHGKNVDGTLNGDSTSFGNSSPLVTGDAGPGM